MPMPKTTTFSPSCTSLSLAIRSESAIGSVVAAATKEIRRESAKRTGQVMDGDLLRMPPPILMRATRSPTLRG